MKIVINTPRGKIGSSLTSRLLGADVDLVLLTRSPDKMETFDEKGVAVHAGNLEDAGFVIEATRGADLLFWVTPADTDTNDLRECYDQLGRIAVKAIEENAIPRVVSLSSIGAQHESGTGPIAGLYDVEKMLEKTGADLRHIRAGFFMENFFMSAATVASQGAMYLPCRGTTRLEMIATADIAEAAAELILDTEWTGRRVVELAGPAAISFDEAAEILGSALERDVRYIQVTPVQAREAMTGMGINEGVADAYLEMYGAFDEGRIVPEHPEQVKRMDTSLDRFAQAVYRPIVAAMLQK